MLGAVNWWPWRRDLALQRSKRKPHHAAGRSGSDRPHNPAPTCLSPAPLRASHCSLWSAASADLLPQDRARAGRTKEKAARRPPGCVGGWLSRAPLARRRRAATPTTPRPSARSAYVDGSGTAAVNWNACCWPLSDRPSPAGGSTSSWPVDELLAPVVSQFGAVNVVDRTIVQAQPVRLAGLGEERRKVGAVVVLFKAV